MPNYSQIVARVLQMRKEPLTGVGSPAPQLVAWLEGINTAAQEMPALLRASAVNDKLSLHAISQAWDRELDARRRASAVELAIVDILANSLHLSQVAHPLRRYTDVRDPYVRNWLTRLTAGMTHVESCPLDSYPRPSLNADVPEALRPYYDSMEPGMLEINSEHAILVIDLANALAAYRQCCRPGDTEPFDVMVAETAGRVWRGSLRQALVQYTDGLTLWISEAARVAMTAYAAKYNAPAVPLPEPPMSMEVVDVDTRNPVASA